ncbi:MAG: hypothetical protein BRC26_02900, partial [Nanohaloarchaea archaeon QH_8_44_6]
MVSGCVKPDLNNDSSNPEAQLIGSVSDQKITERSPGEITLNARNMRNETSEFFVRVSPVGDYDQLVSTTNREGEETQTIQLGEAVESATTGENFAEVRKNLNITANIKVQAELYR